MLKLLLRTVPAAAACTLLALSASDAQSGRVAMTGPTGLDLGMITQREEAIAPGFRTGRGDAPYDADEIIVAFEGGAVSAQSARTFVDAAGLTAQGVSYPQGMDFAIVRLAPGEDPEAAAAALDGTPGVRY